MATSNFIIDDPETAERFVDALEASAQDPPYTTSVKFKMVTDPDEIRSFMDRLRKKHNRNKYGC